MPGLRYDLLAIDLDGTLVDHSGNVSEANVRALARARRAGLRTAVCTGRAYRECTEIIAKIGQTDPVIVSGGAVIACPVTHRTLDRTAMDRHLVQRLVAYLHERGHPALVLKDPAATGYDYLAVSPCGRGPEALDPASSWWFAKMGCTVRYARHLDEDEHPEHTIRVGAYAANRPVDDMAAEVRHRFGHETSIQHFAGVLMADDREREGIMSVHIVELFDARACKWQAIQRLARRERIAEPRIAAIGDQLNDASMIAGAGLGIAMGNAAPELKTAAGQITLTCEEDGVAHAIDRLLTGEW
ncbi:MAG: HAD family hydrolase [Phycisphaerales bacterium]